MCGVNHPLWQGEGRGRGGHCPLDPLPLDVGIHAGFPLLVKTGIKLLNKLVKDCRGEEEGSLTSHHLQHYLLLLTYNSPFTHT